MQRRVLVFTTAIQWTVAGSEKHSPNGERRKKNVIATDFGRPDGCLHETTGVAERVHYSRFGRERTSVDVATTCRQTVVRVVICDVYWRQAKAYSGQLDLRPLKPLRI